MSLRTATTSANDTPGTSTKKRKVDWATIDEPKPFQGFKLKAVTAKIPKKADKKQKTGKPSDGERKRYRDALGVDIVQKNPFLESDLSETRYQVQPTAEWESTVRYRGFTSKCPFCSLSSWLESIILSSIFRVSLFRPRISVTLLPLSSPLTQYPSRRNRN
jgi:hypothetical protein